MKGMKADLSNLDVSTLPDVNKKEVVVPAARRQKAHRLDKPNTLRKKVLGREVVFTRVIIEAADVNEKTSVFFLNERDQDLLNEHGVSDILPSIKQNGINDFEAFARPIECGYELADGSRRRRACVLGNASMALWSAELSDREMEYLSESGNKHKQASVYEKGLVYKRWIAEGRFTSIKDINRETGIDRRKLQRCIHAAELPKWLVAAYKTPNDMSVDASAQLYSIITQETLPIELLKKRVEGCKIMWSKEDYKGSDITKILTAPIKTERTTEDNWLLKNKVKVTPTAKGVKYDITGISAEKREELDAFIEALMK